MDALEFNSKDHKIFLANGNAGTCGTHSRPRTTIDKVVDRRRLPLSIITYTNILFVIKLHSILKV